MRLSHATINSIGVLGACTLAAISLFFTWRTYQQTQEDIVFFAAPAELDYDTRLVRFDDELFFTRRYTLHISNNSATDSSIISAAIRYPITDQSKPKGQLHWVTVGVEVEPIFFRPINVAAGSTEEREIEMEYPIRDECHFPELERMAPADEEKTVISPTNTKYLRSLFKTHGRSFPNCLPLGPPEATFVRPVSLEIMTAKGMIATATATDPSEAP